MEKQTLIDQRIDENYYHLLDEWVSELDARRALEQKTIEELQELLSD